MLSRLSSFSGPLPFDVSRAISFIYDYFGGIDEQSFGYVGNMMLYNKKLTQNQIKQNYDALKNVYKNGDFVINNLKLYFNPSNILSYSGSGAALSASDVSKNFEASRSIYNI